MIVQVADVVFPGSASEGWLMQSLSGWYDVPESREDTVERPISSGSFEPSRLRRRSLTFALSATYMGASELDALQAVAALRSSIAGQTVTATVSDLLGVSTRRVQVRSVDASDHHGRSEFVVKIDMVAFDPHRYGPELCSSTGPSVPGSGAVWPAGPDGSGTAGGYVNWGSAGVPGRVQVSNVGSATAYPRLSVTGLVGSFEVTEVESGRRLRFMRPVLDGSTVVLDGRTRRAVVDGQSDVSSFLTVAEWPSVPAGVTRTYFFEPVDGWSGSPTLQVCVAPAYL